MEKKEMNARTMRKLRRAKQAEILRAHQRDDDFIKIVNEKMFDLSHKFGGWRKLTRIVQPDVPAKFIYFLFTSGMGNQTLGEEYTGIVQANLETYNVPSLFARVVAACLECFGEQMLIRLLNKLEVAVNNGKSASTPTTVRAYNIIIGRLKSIIPIFILVHKGLFYIYGRYYSWGRRLTGINYAKVYGIHTSDEVSWTLRALGIATLAHSAIKLWQSRSTDRSDEDIYAIESRSNEQKCLLCLENLPTTATPCGHVFCWNCIADLLRTRPRCPLCRESVSSSRVTYLMNF